ncbi:MAG: amino acid adenylation domain-containing protein [Cyanophyceae cyanobacterium]
MNKPASTHQLSAAKRALLAKRLRGQPPRQTTIPRREPGTMVPLSFSQQRLWFLDQLEPHSALYNIPFALHIQGILDVEALEQAITAIIARHEILRTNFVAVDGQPQQLVRKHLTVPCARVDLSELPERARAEFQHLAQQEGQKPFDLTRDALLRLTLLELGATEFVLLVTLHHIISDAWSTGIFVRELTAFYQAFSQNRAASLAELPIQYGDFALWQRQPLFEQTLQPHLRYWQQQFKTLPPVLQLPSDHPRPPVPTRGARLPLELDAQLTTALKKLGQDSNATLFMTLLCAFKVLLYRYTGQTDITVGSPVANRTHKATEGLIGAFINTLAFRTAVAGELSFRTALARVRETALGAYTHQNLPFEKLIDELQLVREVSHTPLFQVMLILQNAPSASLSLPGLTIAPLDLTTQTAKFDLTLIFTERAGQLLGRIEYSSDLFDAATVVRLRSHLLTVLNAIVANPDCLIRDLPLLTVPEWQQLQAWNQTETHYAQSGCLHQLVEAQVARTPEAIALTSENQQLTYAELNQRANRLAHHLQSLGVSAEVVVGVCLERSLDLVIALLGILKAGGAYLPLAPALPQERLAFIVADARLKLVIASPDTAISLGESPSLQIISPDAPEAECAPTNPSSRVAPDNLAYVIYTSGSTGTPKGAANTHRGICNRLHWMQAEYSLTAGDRVLQKTPFSFDVSVWEFFWPLMAGAGLHIAQPGGHKDSDYLVRTIVERQITTLHFVPSMLRAFLEAPGLEACRSLRQVFCSGEALTTELQAGFFSRLQAQLHNLYGPTEAAIDVTYWACQRSPQHSDSQGATIPIGRAIANTQIYLLDRHLNPVPVGVPGELYIGGVGLARGYDHRPGLTAERFVPHPFAQAQRLYKTGDLARTLPDGNLEFLGRLDYQVKIRGFRIELGEIEAVLQQHPQVHEVVVVAREDQTGAQKRLVAYLVRHPGNGNLPKDTAELGQTLQKWLQARLPEYMIPTTFVELETLPLNPNGKVDRRALPAPPRSRPPQETAPRSPVEQQLAAIWSELLGIPTVGIDDNFFELGGDSILSLQVVARAQRAGIQLTPKQLFEQQTIRALAQVVGRVKTVAHQQPVTGAVPLTPIQHWFFEQPLVERHHWNQSLLLTLHQPLTLAQLRAIAHYLLNYHDALRLSFHHGSTWTQTNLPPRDTVPCHGVDVSALPETQQTQAIEAAATQVQASLSLADGLCRFVLFETGFEPRLLFVVHHLAIDGVSWRILLEDFQMLYRQKVSGQNLQLPPKTSSFQQWAQRLQTYAQELSPEERCEARKPEAYPVFPNEDNTVATSSTVTVSLSLEDTQTLLQVSAASPTSIDEVLLTAVVQAYAEGTECSQVSIALERHGRESIFDDIDLSRTVGWFTTLFPVWFDGSNASPGKALQAVKEELRRLPHRGLDYGVRRYLSRTSEEDPTPHIRFNYLGQLDRGWTETAVDRGSDTTKLFSLAPESAGSNQGLANQQTHPLTVDGSLTQGQLQLCWTYSAPYRATVQALAHACVEKLRSLLAYCRSSHDYTPSDFPLASLNKPLLERLVEHYAPIADIYPLSPTQQGILFHALYAPSSGVYVTQMCYRLRGALNLSALQQTWQQVSDRHSILRTAFFWDTPLQIVKPYATVPWRVSDWRSLTPNQQQEERQRFLQSDRQRGFQLNVAPLMRLRVLRLAEDITEVLWSFHHLLLDGWSLPLVFQDVLLGYHRVCQGETVTLPARPYRDYIAWLAQQNLARAADFWRQRLRGFNTPTPLVSKEYQSAGSDCSVQRLTFPSETTTELKALAQRAHLTLNTLVQGAWSLLLGHLSGTTDVVFGATTAGRPPDLEGSERMVGLFINTLPVRVQITPAAACRLWLQELQTQQSQARQYEYAPLGQIQRWSDVPPGTRLFDSLVVFENYPIEADFDKPHSLQVESVQSLVNNGYPLTIRAIPGTEFSLEILSDRAFAPETGERWLKLLASLLRWLVEHLDATVAKGQDYLIAQSRQQQQQQAQVLTKRSLNKLQRTRRKAIRSSPEV